MKIRWLRNEIWETVLSVNTAGEPLIGNVRLLRGNDLEIHSLTINPDHKTATIRRKADGAQFFGVPLDMFEWVDRNP